VRRTELILTPLELTDRRAALIPPPPLHRHRYHGVLAPNAPLRAAVTALARAPAATPDQPAVTEPVGGEGHYRSPARTLWAMLIARIDEPGPLRDGTVLDGLELELEFDKFYTLTVDVFPNRQADLSLADDSGLLGQLTGIPLSLPLDSGLVGLLADRTAFLDDFSLKGTAVPIPPAIYLFLSAVMGIVLFQVRRTA